jgi:hypothetical protein
MAAQSGWWGLGVEMNEKHLDSRLLLFQEFSLKTTFDIFPTQGIIYLAQ